MAEKINPLITQAYDRPQKPARQGPRKMTWALIIWSALMALWAIVGGSHAASTCNTTSQAYNTGCQAGTAIGVGLIIGLWFIGFVVLSLIWFMTKPKDH